MLRNTLKAAVIASYLLSISAFAAPNALGLLSLNNLAGLGDFSGTATNITGLAVTTLTSPQSLIGLSTDTGLPLVQGVLPITAVLTNPASIADFFINGGTLLAPSLSAVPAIPLLNMSIPGL